MINIQNPSKPRKLAPNHLVECELADGELLNFALDFAGSGPAAPIVNRLIAEFGDIEIILASTAEDLQARGGLTHRAVAVLKLLHAFRADNRRGQVLN